MRWWAWGRRGCDGAVRGGDTEGWRPCRRQQAAWDGCRTLLSSRCWARGWHSSATGLRGAEVGAAGPRLKRSCKQVWQGSSREVARAYKPAQMWQPDAAALTIVRVSRGRGCACHSSRAASAASRWCWRPEHAGPARWGGTLLACEAPPATDGSGGIAASGWKLKMGSSSTVLPGLAHGGAGACRQGEGLLGRRLQL